MKVTVSRKDIIWSYFGQLLYSGVNILILPFILKLLPEEHLGLWYTFTAIGALAMLLDFGFSTTITRNIAYAWSGGELSSDGNVIYKTKSVNIKYFNKMLFASKKIYLLISICALSLFVLFATPYIYVISIKTIEQNVFLLPWIIYLAAVTLNIYYAYWTPLLKGTGSIKEHYQVIVIAKLAQLILSIVGLLLGYGLLAIAIAYLVSMVTTRVLSKYFFYYFAKTKQFRSELKYDNVDRKDAKETIKLLWPAVYKQGLMSISNYLTDKSGILIISAIFGLAISASYGLTIQIFAVATTVANVYYNSNIASIISDKSRNDKKSAYEKMTAALGIQTIVILASMIFLVIFGNRLLLLINSNSILIGRFQLIAVGVYLVLFNFQLVCSNFIIMDNNFPMVKSYILTGIFIIIIQLIMSISFPNFQLWNVIVVQLIVLATYNAWKWPIFIAKQYDKNYFSFVFDTFKNAYLYIIGLIR